MPPRFSGLNQTDIRARNAKFVRYFLVRPRVLHDGKHLIFRQLGGTVTRAPRLRALPPFVSNVFGPSGPSKMSSVYARPISAFVRRVHFWRYGITMRQTANMPVRIDHSTAKLDLPIAVFCYEIRPKKACIRLMLKSLIEEFFGLTHHRRAAWKCIQSLPHA